MQCLTESECRDWLAGAGLDASLWSQPTALAGGFELGCQIPPEARTQHLLAREFAGWLEATEAGLLWMVEWRYHKPDEGALLRRLRRGHGESRPWAEAPGHLFDRQDAVEIAAWIALAMDFRWDAYFYPQPFGRHLLRFAHDELVVLTAAERARFGQARRIAQRFELEVYREIEP